jgi:hypothetical protein
MIRGLIQRIRGQSEPLSLHLELASPERTGLLAQASSNIAKELNLSRIPPPDSQLSPVLLAARWISHDIYDEDMPGIAADLLEAGYDTPALVRLACEMNLYGAPEAEGLIKKAFEELGVLWPFSEMRAKLIATRQIARQVIAGERDSHRAASHIEVCLWGWHPATKDLGELFGLNDEFSLDAEYRRAEPLILGDQLEVFARLACLTDEEIVLEPSKSTQYGA